MILYLYLYFILKLLLRKKSITLYKTIGLEKDDHYNNNNVNTESSKNPGNIYTEPSQVFFFTTADY